MRALLISPKHERAFWTFEATCWRLGRKALCPPTGLLTVAAMLPSDWEVRLVDLNVRRLAEADWAWADLVMIGGMIAQRDSFRETLKEAKRRGKKVIVGGPYPTSMPDEVLACGCDWLVKGEVEETLPRLLQALQEGQLAGVIEPETKPDMTVSPVPRFSLVKPTDYVVMSIQTSRGCPFDCEFCDVVNLYGRKPRFKTPAQVLAELEAICQMGHRGEVLICDDNFIGHKPHARALLAALIPWSKARGEPFTFWTQATVNLGQDPELMDLMTAANFSTVFIGIESPDEEVLASARKFHNIKNPLLESLNNISRNGLSVVGSFILGIDGEKPGAGDRICAFVEQANLPIVGVQILQVMPNTSLWKRLEREGRLVPTQHTTLGTFVRRMNCIPTRPEAQIFEEWKAAWERLYDPARFLARNYRFHLAMRPTRAAMAHARPGTSAKPAQDKSLSLRDRLHLVFEFLSIAWPDGVYAKHRFQFWRQFFGIRRKNPSRFVRYMSCCGIARDMYRVREGVRAQADEALREINASRTAGAQGGGRNGMP